MMIATALEEPSATLKQVRDVVNSKAAPAEEVEVDETQEVVSEEEATTDEVVSEEEVAADEVVAEAEETEEELVEEEGIDIEADVQALLEGEEPPKSLKKKHALSLKQQSSLRLLKCKSLSTRPIKMH